jgi:hypothetical protein
MVFSLSALAAIHADEISVEKQKSPSKLGVKYK